MILLWLWAAAFVVGVVFVWLLLHRATRKAIEDARLVQGVVIDHRPPTADVWHPEAANFQTQELRENPAPRVEATDSRTASESPAWMRPEVLAEAYREELWLVHDEYMEIWRGREKVIEQGKALSDLLGVLTLKAEAARQQYQVLHQAYAGLNGGKEEASKVFPARIRLQEKGR